MQAGDPGANPGRSTTWPCRLPARTPVSHAGGAGSTPAGATRSGAVAKQQTQRSHTPPIEGASPSSVTSDLVVKVAKQYAALAQTDRASGFEPEGWGIVPSGRCQKRPQCYNCRIRPIVAEIARDVMQDSLTVERLTLDQVVVVQIHVLQPNPA